MCYSQFVCEALLTATHILPHFICTPQMNPILKPYDTCLISEIPLNWISWLSSNFCINTKRKIKRRRSGDYEWWSWWWSWSVDHKPLNFTRKSFCLYPHCRFQSKLFIWIWFILAHISSQWIAARQSFVRKLFISELLQFLHYDKVFTKQRSETPWKRLIQMRWMVLRAW